MDGRVMLREGVRFVGVDGRRMIEREGVDRRVERDGARRGAERAELPRERLMLREVARGFVTLRRVGVLRRCTDGREREDRLTDRDRLEPRLREARDLPTERDDVDRLARLLPRRWASASAAGTAAAITRATIATNVVRIPRGFIISPPFAAKSHPRYFYHRAIVATC